MSVRRPYFTAADGVTALEQLVARHHQQGGLPKGPVTLTAGEGRHYALRQPVLQPLGNRSGNLPQGVDVRGTGGWAVAPGAVRPDGRKWRSTPTMPPLAEAYRAGTIPVVPQWVIDIIRSKPEIVPTPPPPHKPPPSGNGGSAPHEAAFARQTLRGIADELRKTPPNTRRNECLNGGAYRLGRMVARG